MVLICNNNILTIEKFHKNRCSEKKEIQNIIINEAKIDKKYTETPYIQKEKNNSYIRSTNNLNMKQKKSIQIQPNKR
jgi:hypothetical protein